jgi:hypothetical protein
VKASADNDAAAAAAAAPASLVERPPPKTQTAADYHAAQWHQVHMGSQARSPAAASKGK